MFKNVLFFESKMFVFIKIKTKTIINLEFLKKKILNFEHCKLFKFLAKINT